MSPVEIRCESDKGRHSLKAEDGIVLCMETPVGKVYARTRILDSAFKRTLLLKTKFPEDDESNYFEQDLGDIDVHQMVVYSHESPTQPPEEKRNYQTSDGPLEIYVRGYVGPDEEEDEVPLLNHS